MSDVQEAQVLKTVMQNREKILILEKLVQELVNTGYVDQSDYRRFRDEAINEVKKDFSLN